MSSGEQDVATAAKKRTLELEAFSSLVDALRASGPLTPERKVLLQQTASALKISAERYKAEIRRALAKPSLSGEIDETSWAMEGRRDTFLLPRKPIRATLPALPYAAYTTRLTPALVQLPRAPYKTAETQTVTPKVATTSPKLVVVSSPRSQTTHTMVYAKPGGQQRQVRVGPQVTPAQLPGVVVSSKSAQPANQQQQQHHHHPAVAAKLVTVPTVVRSSPALGPDSRPVVTSTSCVNAPASAAASSNFSSSTTIPVKTTLQQQPQVQQPQQQQQQQQRQSSSPHLVVSSAGHHHHVQTQPLQQQQQQHCKQIVITAPANSVVHHQQHGGLHHHHHQTVDKVSVRQATAANTQISVQTVQVRPSVGTPVVTKVLHPNRTTEFKVLQKTRLTQVRSSASPVTLATMTPSGGVCLAPPLANVVANGGSGGGSTKIHINSSTGESVPVVKPPPAKSKSMSQWNYDDHSVMAKPAVVAPLNSALTTKTIATPSGGESSFGSHHRQQQQQQQYGTHYVHQNVHNHHHHQQQQQHHHHHHHQAAASTATTGRAQLTGSGGPQARTVQIVQMSTNAQAPTTPPRIPKPVWMVTPTQMSVGTNNSNNNSSSSINSGANSSNSINSQSHSLNTSQLARPRESTGKVGNVVVQSLPYEDYQGSIYKMVPEDVIMEEEVA